MGSVLSNTPIMAILYAGLISFFASFLLGIFGKASFGKLVDITALLWSVLTVITLTYQVISKIKGLS